ncbi:MAG: Hpt domain-containing protein [Dehalococcoidia bacterium]|jgi:two-component system, sensor histidine kinase and response regulator|nr:Hpt domain-containing protein [Dehalococcoidia bacterium]
MTNEPGFDHGALAELRDLGGDELVAEVITAFLSEAASEVAALHAAAAAADPEALERVAHRFKSASRVVGAMAVSRYAEQLQLLGRAGSTEGAVQIAQALDAEFQLAEAELIPLQEAA